MKIYVVIVAGGSGTRMNNALPKQFMSLNGKPVLFHTINTFKKALPEAEIILVLPETHLGAGQEIIDGFFDYSNIQIVQGGRTRFHSVQNGLAKVAEESIVFVHDAVRCLCSQELIHRCLNAAQEVGSAIPVVQVKDSIRMVVGENNEQLDRSRVFLVQTPQTFHSKIIKPAFDSIDYKEQFTDEATVVEAFGLKVNLVEGEDTNIKITTPIDLVIAQEILLNTNKED